MRGFIANTDFGWFSHFLPRAEPPDAVDFWQPSPHGFRAIPPGAPSTAATSTITRTLGAWVALPRTRLRSSARGRRVSPPDTRDADAFADPPPAATVSGCHRVLGGRLSGRS